jgi:hypothetical protein
MVGLGTFAGAGPNFGYSASRAPLKTGGSAVPVWQAGAGAGAGGEFGMSLGSFDRGLGDLSRGFQMGGGGGPKGAVGGYLGIGAKLSHNWVTPELGGRPR